MTVFSELFSRNNVHKLLFIPARSVHTRTVLGAPEVSPLARRKRQYRSRIDIAANILEIAKEGSRKTRIMYLGNLSYELVQKYLDLLLRFDLVELREWPEKTYIATEKGRRFLEDYYELRRYSEMAETKRRDLEANLPARV